MLRIGICDDELQARETLRFALEKLIDEKNETISYEFSNGKSAVNWIKNHPGELDLLFLDVEMDSLNGMEAAAKIRSFDATLLLVFVTGYNDYMQEGYQVDAMDYLIKPFSTERLRHLLTRVRARLTYTLPESFIFHNADGTYRIPKQDILYFYSDKRLVVLVTDTKELSFYEKLDHIEETLGEPFVRIHQRYLVNGTLVDFIGNNALTINGYTLPFSRSQKTAAISHLARLMLKGDCSDA